MLLLFPYYAGCVYMCMCSYVGVQCNRSFLYFPFTGSSNALLCNMKALFSYHLTVAVLVRCPLCVVRFLLTRLCCVWLDHHWANTRSETGAISSKGLFFDMLLLTCPASWFDDERDPQRVLCELVGSFVFDFCYLCLSVRILLLTTLETGRIPETIKTENKCLKKNHVDAKIPPLGDPSWHCFAYFAKQ